MISTSWSVPDPTRREILTFTQADIDDADSELRFLTMRDIDMSKIPPALSEVDDGPIDQMAQYGVRSLPLWPQMHILTDWARLERFSTTADHTAPAAFQRLCL